MSTSIITFPSTNYAIRAERILKKSGLQADTIPVPRRISSDCGIALRVADTILEGCLAELAAAGVAHASVVPEGDG